MAPETWPALSAPMPTSADGPLSCRLWAAHRRKSRNATRKLRRSRFFPSAFRSFSSRAVLLTPEKAHEYQTLAQAKGDRVEVLALSTGHFELIAPGQDAWATVKKLILQRALSGTPLTR